MINSILTFLLKHWISVSVVAVPLWLARNYFHNGLQKYPGPFMASVTDWWRFFDVLGRRPDVTHNALHRKYGDIVRLGPNLLSFADPKALKSIYGLNKGFTKSEFYPVQQSTSNGRRLPSLFSTTDNGYHAQLRRNVNSAFSMSAMVEYEDAVSITTGKFLDQTEKLFTSQHNHCDFAEWLQYYAFDVIGQITYSKDHGFIDRNEDVDGIISYLGKLFSYVAPIGQMPLLDLLLLKNPIVLLLDAVGVKFFSFPITNFAQARMRERLSKSTSAEKAPKNSNRDDLLSQFLKAKTKNSEFFDDGKVLVMAVSMAFAGSETTAITLAAVFYYLMRNPETLIKLRKEIDGAVHEGKLAPRQDGLTSWSESQSLPYLDAVIKESFRLHPAAGLLLERITPPGGVEICDQHIPGGTIVGCSAWVIHQRPEIFGEDVKAFRPGRWLAVSSEKRKEMEGAMFQFGAGSRTCLGKNISLLEIYKLVPSFLRRFDLHFVDPSKEWRLHNAWFVKQYEFHAYFTPRNVPSTNDKLNKNHEVDGCHQCLIALPQRQPICGKRTPQFVDLVFFYGILAWLVVDAKSQEVEPDPDDGKRNATVGHLMALYRVDQSKEESWNESCLDIAQGEENKPPATIFHGR